MPSSASILCIDDDPKVLWLRAALLSIAGYEVLTAADAEAALPLFREHQIALVITDYIQPESAWEGLVGAMKQHKSEVPVLLYTAYPDPSEAVDYVDRVLAKGMDPAEFLGEVAKLVAWSRT